MQVCEYCETEFRWFQARCAHCGAARGAGQSRWSWGSFDGWGWVRLLSGVFLFILLMGIEALHIPVLGGALLALSVGIVRNRGGARWVRVILGVLVVLLVIGKFGGSA